MSTAGSRCITTPAGVRIGCAYMAPPPRVEGDQARIQAALLERATAQPLACDRLPRAARAVRRAAVAFYRWC